MAVSPDDRFAGLINSSAERGGWVPGDVFASDSEGEEEQVEPRRIRLPILVALALTTVAVLVIAFLLFRPASQHDAAGDQAGSSEGESGEDAGAGSAADTAPAGGQVVVHVTGQVHKPSVVTLETGARVQDAVEAAGGLKNLADADSVNLARILQDGEQIHIPAKGEDPADSANSSANGGSQASSDDSQSSTGDNGTGGSATAASGGDGTAASSGAGSDANSSGSIDLNTADATTLQTLPGVGPVTAEAIIAHRESQPFTSVEDLLLVQGIGPKTFEQLKDRVFVG